MSVDLSRIASRLEEDVVGWLTTVRANGQPQTSIVWFLREGNDLLIYSRRKKPKLANIASNPHVAFNLQSDSRGHSIITVEGTAVIEGEATPADENPEFIRKYASVIRDSGWTNRSFSEDYPVLLRIQVHRLRARI